MEQVFNIALNELPSKQIRMTDRFTLAYLFEVEFEEGEVYDIISAQVFKGSVNDQGDLLDTFWALHIRKPNRFGGILTITMRAAGHPDAVWHNPVWPIRGRHKWPPVDALAAHLKTRETLSGYRHLVR